MPRNLKQGFGWIALALIAMLCAWFFPGVLLFPLVVTATPWGSILGPLLAILAFALLLLGKRKPTGVEVASLAVGAFVWMVGAIWNAYAFHQKYQIRTDLLLLLPALWGSVLALLFGFGQAMFSPKRK